MIVVALVLVAASGLFAVQLTQAYAQCSARPGSAPCADVSSVRIALDGLFVALAGGLAAIVMAISTGINWRNEQPPNTALAQRLQSEEEAFREQQERLSQLQEMRELAVAHAQAQAQRAATGGEAAPGGSEVAGEEAGGVLIEEEETRPETPDEARRRVLADRLRTLARNRPEVVADVVRSWIDRSSR